MESVPDVSRNGTISTPPTLDSEATLYNTCNRLLRTHFGLNSPPSSAWRQLLRLTYFRQGASRPYPEGSPHVVTVLALPLLHLATPAESWRATWTHVLEMLARRDQWESGARGGSAKRKREEPPLGGEPPHGRAERKPEGRAAVDKSNGGESLKGEKRDGGGGAAGARGSGVQRDGAGGGGGVGQDGSEKRGQQEREDQP